jgi:hypothetical protein
MDNGAILNTNGNEFNGFDNLRVSEENLRQETVNPRIRPAEDNTGTQIETDLLELSEESIDLARLEDPRFTEEAILEPANTDLLQEIGTGAETTGLVGANLENTGNVEEVETTVLANENEAVITATATNTTDITTETELITEPEETAAVTEALEAEAAAAAPTAPENIAAEETAAAAGPAAIIAETEPTPETEPIPEETAVPIEEQANRLARVNNALNTANGLTVGATNQEAETPGEAARNEQQILLQNVGSQLAQVIPPASVFSVVG